MTIHAAFAALRKRLTGSAFPAFFRSKRAADISGPALDAATKRSDADLTLLGARRLALIEEARRQRNLRRSKAASACEAQLRAVTLQILAAGEP